MKTVRIEFEVDEEGYLSLKCGLENEDESVSVQLSASEGMVEWIEVAAHDDDYENGIVALDPRIEVIEDEG